MKKIWAIRFMPILLTTLLVVFLSNKPILAQQGCCSFHSGVCGCDCSVGRKVCCDGMYSPTCTCPLCQQQYNPIPQFPKMDATWEWSPNYNKTYNIKVTLADPSPTYYSAVISKCKGCNPGPLTDFNSNVFYFENILPGRWYLNVKKAINGYWSTISYWMIEVPAWVPPTPKPTPTLAPKAIVISSNNANNISIGIVLLGLFALGIIYLVE